MAKVMVLTDGQGRGGYCVVWEYDDGERREIHHFAPLVGVGMVLPPPLTYAECVAAMIAAHNPGCELWGAGKDLPASAPRDASPRARAETESTE